MYFHQKLVVYYILDYFGILFILDINSVLIEFILWDQRLLKGFILRNNKFQLRKNKQVQLSKKKKSL